MRISLPLPGARRRGGAARPARRRWLLLPLILILIGGLVAWRLQRSSTAAPATTSARVTQGTLTVTVSGSGTVAAARTVELPFRQAGAVAAVHVQVGDQVTAGQVLAALDPGDLQLQLQQAQANLKAAEAQLAQVRGGGASEQDLASAQAQLAAAQAQLEETRSGGATATDLRSAQAQLAAAQAQLAALTNPTPADIAAAERKVAQAQLALQSTRDSASQQKTNAELSLQNAVNSLTQAQVAYATARGNWQFVQQTGQDPTNPETTDASGRTVKNKLNETQRQQYYDTFARAEAALKSAENAVTQAQVAYDAARQSEVTQIAQAEAAVAEAQAALDALRNPSPAALAQAEAAVTQAQANLEQLRQGATAAELAQAEAAVTQAQANLEQLTAPGTEAELAAAEASVIQAQVAVAAAEQALAEATLTAPFDGVVAAVSVTPGSIVSAGVAAVTILDCEPLHVAVSLSESDAAQVAVGQPVTLTFDALPDVTLTGTVATVAPAATVAQNVVTYPVTVAFDAGAVPVKVGMSASADIQVQEVRDALLVPSRAVQTVDGVATVTVLRGPGQPTRLQVRTGVTSDGQTVIAGCVDAGALCLKAGDVLQVPGTTTGGAQSANRTGSSGFGFGVPGGPPPGR
ncbi:MAG TPA: efflux RND transporter periplasmic adaptor subunit [Roseiflexaceae bacterium]|nr:efflux RND transporter periplasmic adaptor subunit [Roseiflexaceae bacterium]